MWNSHISYSTAHKFCTCLVPIFYLMMAQKGLTPVQNDDNEDDK